MHQHNSQRHPDHECRCSCAKCKEGKHCHNLAAGCRASHW